MPRLASPQHTCQGASRYAWGAGHFLQLPTHAPPGLVTAGPSNQHRGHGLLDWRYFWRQLRVDAKHVRESMVAADCRFPPQPGALCKNMPYNADSPAFCAELIFRTCTWLTCIM